MASHLSSIRDMTFGKPGTRITESRQVVVKLRARAHTDDLDTAWAKTIIGMSENNALHGRVFEYKEEGIVGFDFRNGEPLTGPTEIERWHTPVFRVVTEWLREKPTGAFRPIMQAGSSVDLFIGGYNGYVPLDLLREVVRLELNLLVLK